MVVGELKVVRERENIFFANLHQTVSENKKWSKKYTLTYFLLAPRIQHPLL